jgi:hypothetical protein
MACSAFLLLPLGGDRRRPALPGAASPAPPLSGQDSGASCGKCRYRLNGSRSFSCTT